MTNAERALLKKVGECLTDYRALSLELEAGGDPDDFWLARFHVQSLEALVAARAGYRALRRQNGLPTAPADTAEALRQASANGEGQAVS